jgi:RNA polymerase sigma-70 factor (ECF subfamily)
MLTKGLGSSTTEESIARRDRQERFMQLLGPVQKRLEAFCFAMARDEDEAMDLVGETVLRAYEHFHKVRDAEAFLSYLFTIASRLHKRKRWRGRVFGSFDADNAEQVPWAGTAPDVSVDVEKLYEALARLPEQQREAVVMYEISGLSVAEIREIQGGSLSSVKMRLSRARKALSLLLGAEISQAMPEPSVHDKKAALKKKESHVLNLKAASHE